MSEELTVIRERRFRSEVPKNYQSSLDTRVQWLWAQRFGTVQAVWAGSKDTLDRLAATIILQAILGKDLNNVVLLFKRLEGGAIFDTELLEIDEELVI